MKDFDAERTQREQHDRRLKIGGKEFTYKAAVAPEVIIRWNKAATGELGELAEEQWLDLFDETILRILDSGQEAAWKEIRAVDAAHPLNISDMRAVIIYLIQEATGRPTGEPSGSSSGGTTTETPLRVVSSLPEDAPSEISPRESAAT